MDRCDFFHKTPQENIDVLFNMIQACRVDLSIMRNNPDYKSVQDNELVKVAQALAQECEYIFKTAKG